MVLRHSSGVPQHNRVTRMPFVTKSLLCKQTIDNFQTCLAPWHHLLGNRVLFVPHCCINLSFFKKGNYRFLLITVYFQRDNSRILYLIFQKASEASSADAMKDWILRYAEESSDEDSMEEEERDPVCTLSWWILYPIYKDQKLSRSQSR